MTDEVMTNEAPAIAPISTAEPAAEPIATEAPSNDFRAQLPEQYRSLYPEFKNPSDFVKGYDELVKKLGSSVSLPKENATPEELGKFYSKLGRPETPDKYEFSTTDDNKIDTDFLAKFKQAAYDNGINQNQAKQLFDWYNREAQTIENQSQQAFIESQAKAEAQLKVKWGRDYENKLQEVQSFAKNIAGDKFENLAKYGNDPDFISLLADIKDRYVREDRMVTQSTSNNEPLDIRGEARKIMSEPDYSQNEVKQAKVRELFKRYATQLGNNAK